jgi:aryl-alcohol dehydrogenase-like predicted oxidoreductase
VYGLGHSEEVVARALGEWRGPRPFVFTKCSLAWDAKGNVHKEFSPASIHRECEHSLRRLHVETIDLYQMHWPPEDSDPALEDAWGTLAALKKEGKVRWIGVSNFNAAQIQRVEKSLQSLLFSRPIRSFATRLKRRLFRTVKVVPSE